MVTHLQLLRSILVASDTAGTIHVWSMDDYSELQNINAHRNSITSMQIYESRILSGSSDGTVKEWNLESGELARKLADSDAVWRVGYSRGRPVAVLARDGNVVLEVSFLCNLKDCAMKLIVTPTNALHRHGNP